MSQTPTPDPPAGVDVAHLDLDGLADHLAGEVDARAHLSTCGGCTARLAELDTAGHPVLDTLHALPLPAIPDDVADRIGARLAAEPPLATEPTQAAEPPQAAARPGPAHADGPCDAGRPEVPPAREATVVPLAGRRRRQTWLPAVAAGVVLVAGGLLGYNLVAGAGSGDRQAATASRDPAGAAPTAQPPEVPTVRSGLDYADGTAVQAALPRVLGGTAAAARSGSQAESAAGADPLAPLRDPATLADCLRAVLTPGEPAERPLALDYAAYAGAPALAVVLGDPDPARVAVYLVGPRCSRADADVRQFLRLRRP